MIQHEEARDEVQLLAPEDVGALLRVVAGDLAGLRGPGVTHRTITRVDATVSAGAQASLPWNADDNALVYVLAGRGSVGSFHGLQL
jgi:redox-sensitive bicupin YhaK (pirin superfamily)